MWNELPNMWKTKSKVVWNSWQYCPVLRWESFSLVRIHKWSLMFERIILYWNCYLIMIYRWTNGYTPVYTSIYYLYCVWRRRMRFHRVRCRFNTLYSWISTLLRSFAFICYWYYMLEFLEASLVSFVFPGNFCQKTINGMLAFFV